MARLTSQTYYKQLLFFVENPTLDQKLKVIKVIKTEKNIRSFKLPINLRALADEL